VRLNKRGRVNIKKVDKILSIGKKTANILSRLLKLIVIIGKYASLLGSAFMWVSKSLLAISSPSLTSSSSSRLKCLILIGLPLRRISWLPLKGSTWYFIWDLLFFKSLMNSSFSNSAYFIGKPVINSRPLRLKLIKTLNSSWIELYGPVFTPKISPRVKDRAFLR